MAYQYETGTANDVPHWFTLLETFLTTVGWTVEDGTGTTTVVFSSIGEGGGRTKLFIRFHRHTTPQFVMYSVRDDVGGTHKTTEGTYAEQIVAPGAGDIPFQYWMAADKDKVIVNYKGGPGYTGCYVGLVEPFALSVDEEEQMIAIALHENISPDRMGYVLKGEAGAWNQSIRGGELANVYIKDPLDNSVAILALRVDEMAFNKIVGQPTDVSGRMNNLPGINPEDIITTGYAGATSTWIVMGTGTMRWCMRTGGVVPVGQIEGAHFAHSNGLAASMADFQSKLLAFMTAIGWTKIANPSPLHPIDYFFNSAGESGVDDIYMHIYHKTNNIYYHTVSDDTALTHEITEWGIGPLPPSAFPTYYYLTGDRDCLYCGVEISGLHKGMWAGMYQLFMPDPDSYATEYKVGDMYHILRGHDGTWDQALATRVDGYLNSSPNLYDGVTNIIWPYAVGPTNKEIIGTCKYFYRLSGLSLTFMDAVTIGGRSFRYFYGPSPYNFAFREA